MKMEKFQVITVLHKGNGYGFILFPGLNINVEGDIKVKVTVNGHSDIRDAVKMYSGEYMFVFNREQLALMQINYGDSLDVEIERIDAPPELNDMPADLLSGLHGAGIEEDFKRLNPDDQKEYFHWVLEAKEPEIRRIRIDQIVQKLKELDPKLPRGESL